MPKVEKRVARKAYEREGIKPGDTYYYTKIKLQRGGLVMRSLTPFKQSQLTQSPFKSGWLAMQEAWEESDKGADAIQEAANAIRSLGEDAQGAFDNMPEGLQQGDTGQMLEARATACNEAADTLDGLSSEMADLDMPEDFDEEEPPEDDPDDDDGDSTYGGWEERRDEHETAVSEYESEIERITDEADGLIGDMPE